MKVAVVGASGQLGTDLVRAIGRGAVPLTHDEIELTDETSIGGCLDGVRPDVVVNTAAAHHVEDCEKRPDHAHAVNATGVRDLARWCSANGARLIHVSTDYVFDGAKGAPYVETDAASPLNVYGASKLAGERLALASCRDTAVVRVSGLYGVHPCRAKGANFVDKMLELAGTRDSLRVVDDEVLTPTSTAETARQIVHLLDADLCGVVHATAQGSCSWYRFAREIFDAEGIDIDLQVADPGEFKAKVPRPKYSVLDNARLREAGLDVLRPWQDGLRDYLTEREAAAA